jgi:anti-sigma regulatory factor (Ser/Thr protein kinase)
MSADFPVRPDLAQVAVARREVVRLARKWRIPFTDERFEDLKLLADEVVANAVRHTRAPCTVTVRWTGARLRVEVADSSPQRPKARKSPPDAEGGRGLVLVDALAADWGTTDTPTGKIVWFEIGCRPPSRLRTAPPSGRC